MRLKQYLFSLLALCLLFLPASPASATVFRYVVAIYDTSGALNDFTTGTSIVSMTIQRLGTAGGASIAVSTSISTVTISAPTATPTTITTGTTSATVIGTTSGQIIFDVDVETLGDLTITINTLAKTGKTYAGAIPPILCTVADNRINQAFTSTGGVNVASFGGTSVTGRDIGASVLLSPGTGTGQISITSGALTVGTNNDKTGYALTQTFPTNFSSLAIDGSGRVDVSKIGGTSQTARDLGASVLLSSGTGTGQISLSSGAVLLQAVQTGVTIPTVTTLTNAPSDTSGTTTLLSRIASALTITSGSVNANLLSYTPNGGSLTNLGASFAFPNGLMLMAGTGTSQISLVGGAVALQSGQSVSSVSGSVGSVSGNVGGNISGNVTGSVGSVAGDVSGKVLGGGASAFVANGVQVTDYTSSIAALSTKLGTPAGASVSADILTANTSLSTLTTRVPAVLPTFPTNFSVLDISVSGVVTSTGGGGGGGLSSGDIAAIWAYLVPNTPTSGSIIELIKNKLTPMTFDGSNNIYSNLQALGSTANNSIRDNVWTKIIDGSLTAYQVQAICLATLSGAGTVTTPTAPGQNSTSRYKRADGSTTISTVTTTYTTDGRYVTGRSPSYTNLP